MYNMRRNGFTIIELMIVVVVIAILAAVAIVGFGSVREKATEASTRAELTDNHKLIGSYKAVQAKVPADVNPQCRPLGSVDGNNKLCLASSKYNEAFEYTRINDENYTLTVTRGAYKYSINQDGTYTKEDGSSGECGFMFCSSQ